MGASPDGDRAAGLRPQPPAASSQSSIPSAACIECGGAARLTNGREIYPHRPDLYHKSFYKCGCGAYCGCHPGTTTPLGSPCGPETRKARSAAHAAFDPLWKRHEMSRQSAYAWLSKATGIPPEQCHVGMMSQAQARSVVSVCVARAQGTSASGQDAKRLEAKPAGPVGAADAPESPTP